MAAGAPAPDFRLVQAEVGACMRIAIGGFAGTHWMDRAFAGKPSATSRVWA